MKNKTLLNDCKCIHCQQKLEQLNNSRLYWARLILNKKAKNVIRFSDKVDEYYHNKDNNLSFDLTDSDLGNIDLDFSTRNGSDLDALDNVIQFPNMFSDDIISFTPDPEFESRMNPEEE